MSEKSDTRHLRSFTVAVCPATKNTTETHNMIYFGSYLVWFVFINIHYMSFEDNINLFPRPLQKEKVYEACISVRAIFETVGSLSFTFPGTANGRFEFSWQNFR